MFIKLILNILINIGIFVLFLSLLWAFNHQQYALLAGIVFTLCLFAFLKIRMIKSVKELTKKRNSNTRA